MGGGSFFLWQKESHAGTDLVLRRRLSGFRRPLDKEKTSGPHGPSPPCEGMGTVRKHGGGGIGDSRYFAGTMENIGWYERTPEIGINMVLSGQIPRFFVIVKKKKKSRRG